jgi:hypothetical protein
VCLIGRPTKQCRPTLDPPKPNLQVSPSFQIPEKGKGILYLDGIKLLEVRQQQLTIRFAPQNLDMPYLRAPNIETAQTPRLRISHLEPSNIPRTLQPNKPLNPKPSAYFPEY